MAFAALLFGACAAAPAGPTLVAPAEVCPELASAIRAHSWDCARTEWEDPAIATWRGACEAGAGWAPGVVDACKAAVAGEGCFYDVGSVPAVCEAAR